MMAFACPRRNKVTPNFNPTTLAVDLWSRDPPP